jgi:hypothetical protein
MFFIGFRCIHQSSRVEVQIVLFDERGNRSVLAHGCFEFRRAKLRKKDEELSTSKK